MHLLRLDDLVGRKVRDESGRVVGRIYEVRGVERAGVLEIVEYHLGAHALAERVSFSVRRLFGRAPDEPTRVPWDRLDVTDPERPTLRSL